MTLVDAHSEFQTLLELHRRDPDDEHVWGLFVESRERLERLWLEYRVRWGCVG